MAHRVVWSPAAVEDVEAIAAYISRDSTSYAAAVVKSVLDSIRYLENFLMQVGPFPSLTTTIFEKFSSTAIE